jgi:hypothetical protein
MIRSPDSFGGWESVEGQLKIVDFLEEHFVLIEAE